MYMGGPFTGLVKAINGGGGFSHGGSSGGGASVAGGAGGVLIGPFKASQGCPAGSVVAHRYGQGLKAMVQCRTLPGPSAPAPSAPNITISNEAPTVDFNANVSPVISPQQSPVISPIIDSPGAGFSANPAQTMPIDQGNRSSEGTSAQDVQRLLAEQANMQEQARIREAQIRDEAAKQRAELEKALQETRNAAQAQEYQFALNQQQMDFQRQMDEIERIRQQDAIAMQRALDQASEVETPVITSPGYTVPGAAIVTQESAPPEPEKEPFPVKWVLIGGGALLSIGLLLLSGS